MAHEFDPNCDDCKPCLLDPTTKKVLPDDHPYTIIARKLFDEQTMETKMAWGRCILKNSRDPEDLKLTNAFMEMMIMALGPKEVS